ncbi:hypothetical protein [Thioalkalivibrio sp. ALMg11]|uniref:hypothetical protein n=1 Tax=Thioalkalivibrio sp. ALMg11 TaxID=1158165 RepID=UPI000361AFD2|nr:hypothetical protein [Thioalkalivibrio sp. ALMg11]
MAATKTATVTLRIDLAVKDVQRTAAVREHRSIACMVAALIRGLCDKHNIFNDKGKTVAGPFLPGPPNQVAAGHVGQQGRYRPLKPGRPQCRT